MSVILLHKAVAEILSRHDAGYSGSITFGSFITEMAEWDQDGRYLDGGPWYEENGRQLDIPKGHRT